MTVPRTMEMPHLNHEAFQKALDRKLIEADGMEIVTRAEVRMADAKEQLAHLDAEGAAIRAEVERTRDAIADLQKLLVKQEAAEADVAIERNSYVQMIHALQQSGVSGAKT